MSHVAKQTDLDTTDQKILRILTDDARLSIAEISEQIHLSPTPTIRRIKRLEDIGVIQAITLLPILRHLATLYRSMLR